MEHDGNEASSMQTENTYFIDYIAIQPSSLQNVAAMSIAIYLWTRSDMRNDIEQQSESDEYYKLARKVLEMITNKNMPKILGEEVARFIRPIGLQVMNCFDSNVEGYQRSHDLFAAGAPFRWTVTGIVDEVKSFQALLNESNLDVSTYRLFELACNYCSEEAIRDVWEKIPHVYGTFNYISRHYGTHLIFYWLAVLENTISSCLGNIVREDMLDMYDLNQSILCNMTTNAVYTENIFALKYFWTKITEEEKNANISIWLNYAIGNCHWTFVSDRRKRKYKQYYTCTEVMCFLLSHLNDQNQQKEVFQSQSETILKSLLLTYPFQTYFLPTISVMLDYLQDDVYVKIMENIVDIMKDDSTTRGLFWDVWNISPLYLKQSFNQLVKNSPWIVLKMLTSGSVDAVITILKDCPAEEKKQIIFNMIDADHKLKLLDFVYANQMKSLDLLMSETLFSNDDISTLKQSMLEHAGVLFENLKCVSDFQNSKEFLNWGFQSEDEVQRFKNEEIEVVEFYCTLMHLGDRELVNKFMNWYFKTAEEMNEFKKTFITNGDHNYRILKHDWALFERYVNDCLGFCSTEEITKFKEDLLEISQITSLLMEGKLEVATSLLKWCMDSDDEVNQYKRKLLLSPEGVLFLSSSLQSKLEDGNAMENAIKWFAPYSNETLANLKMLLNDDSLFFALDIKHSMEKKRRLIFHLLDSFVAKYNTPDCENDFKDDELIKSIINE